MYSSSLKMQAPSLKETPDPSYTLYRAVYKRLHARKRLKLIDEDTFNAQKIAIAKLRNEVLEEKITFANYKTEMDKI